MAKTINETLTYPGASVAEVAALALNPEFRAAVASYQHALRSEITVTPAGAGHQVRYEYAHGTDRVPSFAKKLVGLIIVRRRPTLPQPLGCSTIGAERLNFRVRNGAGCFPNAMAAETLWSYLVVLPNQAPQLTTQRVLGCDCGVCCGWVPDRNSGTTQWTRNIFEGQALGLLVPVGWALLLYTSGLSTQSSTGGLTRLTRWETSS
jgi:hypothetical protein